MNQIKIGILGCNRVAETIDSSSFNIKIKGVSIEAYRFQKNCNFSF